jgi:hypothetical protein
VSKKLATIALNPKDVDDMLLWENAGDLRTLIDGVPIVISKVMQEGEYAGIAEDGSVLFLGTVEKRSRANESR